MNHRTLKIAISALLALSPLTGKAADLIYIPQVDSANYSAVDTLTATRQALAAAVSTNLGLPLGSGLTYIRTSSDAAGQKHVRFSRNLNGYPIVGTQIIAHLNTSGQLVEITAAGLLLSGVQTSPSISPAVASSSALAHANAESSQPASETSSPALCYIFEKSSGAVTLAFKVKVSSFIDGIPSKRDYFINAQNGSVITYHENVVEGLNRVISNANGTFTYGAPSRSEGQGPVSNSAVNIAYDNWGYIYNYFKNSYGRDSYNGAGSSLLVTANIGSPYVNAFWDGENKRWGLGSGGSINGYNFGNFALAYDIAAHEYFHAITDETSNLLYEYQSGALNESLSDVFGAVLEAHRDGGVSADTWRMGEDIGPALRRMDAPSSVSLFGEFYPDHMSEYQYLPKDEDEGGVHTNSSIPNHAFYLLSQGGSHATSNSVINVQGIGIDEAAHIFYYANQNYFVESTDFQQAAYSTARVALSRGKRQLASTLSAWNAVGVVPVWGGDGDGWKLTFAGWTYFDLGGYAWSGDFGWVWWSHTEAHGDTYLYLMAPVDKWIFTSAEIYPWFYDYTSQTWKQNINGSFN